MSFFDDVERTIEPDPPPVVKEPDDRCVECKSRALLLPGYCICDAAVCRLCANAHNLKCESRLRYHQHRRQKR